MQNSDLPLFKPYLPPEAALMPRLREVLYSGQISEGKPVKEFEQAFGKRFGVSNVLSFYSGTAALHTALILAGVRPGDEVVTTAMTAEPTNLAVLHAGGRPVWADVDPASGNMDPEALQTAISPATKAVIVVHYGGIPASLGRIRRIAAAAGIAVIEDAAHALGARYDNEPIGCRADYTMFSLQAIKHMTTVDGGMLACAEPGRAAYGRLVKWFGIDREAPRTETDVKVLGYKYHMNNVTATMGLVQLEYIDQVIRRHQENGRYLDAALQGIPGLRVCRFDAEAEPSYWFYTVLAERRDDLSRKLTALGIGNSLAHRRNDLHTIFRASRKPLPGLDEFYGRMLHLPCGWWVTDDDRERITAALKDGW